jgi:hypothetical protein
MKKLFELLIMPWRKYKERQQLKRRLEELRKRDPFIYK